jgi:hypothetical protein
MFRFKPWSQVFETQIDLKKVRFYLRDGTSGTPNELEIIVGDGTLTYDEKRNMEYKLSRGLLDDVREGDQVPVDVKIDFKWSYIVGRTGSSGENPSVEDVVKNKGNAATWVSSDPDACRPFAVDIVMEYKPTPANCGDQEIITLADFRYESISHDPKTGMCSMTGKCNIVEASAVRSAQSS